MLNPFIKQIISEYDEKQYRIGRSDWSIILKANSQFTEAELPEPQVSTVSQYRIIQALSAANIIVPKDGVILDLCCGTGIVAKALISQKKADHVICIDLSNAQLDLLRQTICNDSELQGRLTILHADALQLPLENDSVDMVIGNSFLHHFPDVRAGLLEIRRVLRPEGRLVIIHEPSLTSTFFESFPLSLLKSIKVENYTDIWKFDPEDLFRLLVNVGFMKVKILRTGILGNVLIGSFSIFINKFFPRFRTSRLILDRIRWYLYALEYQFCWDRAPSLLIQASNST